MLKLHAAKAVGTLCDRKGRTFSKVNSLGYANVNLDNVTCAFCIERLLTRGYPITAAQAEMLPRKRPLNGEDILDSAESEDEVEFDPRELTSEVEVEESEDAE